MDPDREFVISIDTAHIPKVRSARGRTFEAIVGHCARGGVGNSPGPVFGFSGTSANELWGTALLSLANQGYIGRGEISVISDGEDCLKRLARNLPQPVTHILDWFHISMKIQPLQQAADALTSEFHLLSKNVERIKWRLWNGQPDRAAELIVEMVQKFASSERPEPWVS